LHVLLNIDDHSFSVLFASFFLGGNIKRTGIKKMEFFLKNTPFWASPFKSECFSQRVAFLFDLLKKKRTRLVFQKQHIVNV